MQNKLITAITAGAIAMIGSAFAVIFLSSQKGNAPLNLPERAPSFEELMALADKNKASESLIQGYFNSVPTGTGTAKVIDLAEQGNLSAMTLACAVLNTGLGGVQDLTKSSQYCQSAADAGSTAAKANLIFGGFNSNPNNGNWQETHDAFTALMKIAPARAHQGLQFLYKQNHPKASYKSMEHHALEGIKLDNTLSMYGLAMTDLFGPPQVQNFKRAEQNLKRAYELYDFDSGLALAREYRNGTRLKQNEDAYTSMVKRMAKFEHRDSIAELAYMYDTGRGVAQNQATSTELHLKAAALGSTFSQEMVGYRLIKSKQIQERKKGIAYLEATAAQGKIDAMRALSEFYARKDIADPENNKTKWRAMAALHGDEPSQEILGFGYRETGYIEQMAPYIDVLNRAHESGNVNASFLLARHYRAASGVKRDIRKAQKILNSVKNSGHPRVKEEFDIIQSHIEFFGGIDAIPAIIKQNG